MKKRKKVALIHDWLNGMRGGEKVLEEIISVYPQADIFTLFLEKEKISSRIAGQRIFTSGLNRNRWIRKKYRFFLPLFPRAVESFDLSSYDLVISSSHCAAKGVVPAPQSRHFCYIHSPMRYIWDQYHRYFHNLGFLKRYYIRKQAVQLRIWDTLSSMRVDYFIANSRFVKDRVQRYYKRDAVVIHPPVDIEFFTPGGPARKRGEYYLAVSALVPYKRVDQLVRVFNSRSDKLLVVGKGSEEKRLKRMANANIQFYKDLSSEELRDLYRAARAVVFSGVEDFGIFFAEAQACGVPVIAYRKGGVCDIIPSNCGLLYEQADDQSLHKALERFPQMNFDPVTIRENSLRFSRRAFRENFARYVEDNSHD